jgi:hypothetical protein
MRLLAEVAELRTALQRTRSSTARPTMDSLLDACAGWRRPTPPCSSPARAQRGRKLFRGARCTSQSRAAGSRSWWSTAGAIPTTLLESELFGHEKGSFTGAETAQLGRLVPAEPAAPCLLDEIGELPLEAQCRLPALRCRRSTSTPSWAAGLGAHRRPCAWVAATKPQNLQAGGARPGPLPRWRTFYHPPERRAASTSPPARVARRKRVPPPGGALLPRCTALMYGRPTIRVRAVWREEAPLSAPTGPGRATVARACRTG